MSERLKLFVEFVSPTDEKVLIYSPLVLKLKAVPMGNRRRRSGFYDNTDYSFCLLEDGTMYEGPVTEIYMLGPQWEAVKGDAADVARKLEGALDMENSKQGA